MQILIYLLLGISSFFFVVVPISGSFVLNPLLALIVDPHAAISVAAFFFLINSIVKTITFKSDIQTNYIKKILPISFLFAGIGAFAVGLIPDNYLLITILLLSFYFLYKTAKALISNSKKIKKSNNLVVYTMSIFSGFMQGAGVGSGGSLRKAFLLSDGLTLQQMHGTTSFISAILLMFSVVVRLLTDQVDPSTLVSILYLLPIIVGANVLGKKFLKQVSKRNAQIITVIVMVGVIVGLITKIY